MPQVKLYYFNFKGLGEPCRLLLSYGGEPFEDSPFGQLPLLEIDGKLFAQSIAISRYLGKKYGISGSNLEEDLEIDQIVDFINDIKFRSSAIAFETDKTLKEERHERNAKEYYPEVLGNLHETVTKNNGHLVLGRLTWADFYFVGLFDFFEKILRMPDFKQKYPGFAKLEDNVLSIPKVKAYVDADPKPDIKNYF